jgi:hypothetical protein
LVQVKLDVSDENEAVVAAGANIAKRKVARKSEIVRVKENIVEFLLGMKKRAILTELLECSIETDFRSGRRRNSQKGGPRRESGGQICDEYALNTFCEPDMHVHEGPVAAMVSNH